MEIAKKPFLEQFLQERKVFKTKITTDEERELPRLQLEKLVAPKKGCLVLSTFFITSGVAAELASDAPFDYVIVDEASQALLPMIAAAKRLGRKSLFVGDVKQLPPVVQMKGSKIRENKYTHLVEGLNSITEMSLYPTYQLTESRRLTERGTQYTGVFYDHSLVSKSEHKGADSYGIFFMNSQGGPTLLKTDMEYGELTAQSAMDLALAVVATIHQNCKSKEVAVLACMKETVRGLQKKLNSNLKKSNLIVDTVARVQGLTTDICVYVIPNTHYLRSLNPRLFNVATSRARYQTIIIADKEIMDYSRMDIQVKEYLEKLDEEFSFYLPYNNKLKLTFNNMDQNLIG
jgi:ATP-dependent exoDNAse (exonuclease V) alpha subunit